MLIKAFSKIDFIRDTKLIIAGDGEEKRFLNKLIEQSEVIVIPNSTEEISNIQIPEDKIIIDFSRIKKLENHKNYIGLNW